MARTPQRPAAAIRLVGSLVVGALAMTGVAYGQDVEPATTPPIDLMRAIRAQSVAGIPWTLGTNVESEKARDMRTAQTRTSRQPAHRSTTATRLEYGVAGALGGFLGGMIVGQKLVGALNPCTTCQENELNAGFFWGAVIGAGAGGILGAALAP